MGIEDGGNGTRTAHHDQKKEIIILGDVVRKGGDCLEKEIMEGTTPGARKQGKPRMRWMEQWTGMPFKDLLKTTRDRRKWSRLVHEATNPRIEDKKTEFYGFHPFLWMVEDKTLWLHLGVPLFGAFCIRHQH